MSRFDSRKRGLNSPNSQTEAGYKVTVDQLATCGLEGGSPIFTPREAGVQIQIQSKSPIQGYLMTQDS